MSPNILIQEISDAIYKLVKDKKSDEAFELTQKANAKVAELKTILEQIESTK